MHAGLTERPPKVSPEVREAVMKQVQDSAPDEFRSVINSQKLYMFPIKTADVAGCILRCAVAQRKF